MDYEKDELESLDLDEELSPEDVEDSFALTEQELSLLRAIRAKSASFTKIRSKELENEIDNLVSLNIK